MRYQQDLGTIKTRHWAALWRSNILNLEHLQSLTGQSGFVAIDVEPWGEASMDVAEIGLSLIYHFDLSMAEQRRKTIQQLQSQVSITTHTIKISGRE